MISRSARMKRVQSSTSGAKVHRPPLMRYVETVNKRYLVTTMGELPVENGMTPEARAEQAARDLSDRGLAVTARAVRASAGVRMVVAVATAKAWKEAETEQEREVIPAVPEDVQGRLSAI